MSESMETQSPSLAAPGAGLPKPELFIIRCRFALIRWRGNRESFIQKFSAECATIQALIESCSDDQRNKPVLIPRPRGLEDSSRNWSMWMTLDHLRITNLAFARFIDELTQDTIPDIVANTADVKPDPDVTVAVEKEFEESCNTLLEVLKNAPDLKTAQKFPHPWFGPLDAYGWLALAALHMQIHRGQLSAILRGLQK